jgi:hypothetical protein
MFNLAFESLNKVVKTIEVFVTFLGNILNSIHFQYILCRYCYLVFADVAKIETHIYRTFQLLDKIQSYNSYLLLPITYNISYDQQKVAEKAVFNPSKINDCIFINSYLLKCYTTIILINPSIK